MKSKKLWKRLLAAGMSMAMLPAAELAGIAKLFTPAAAASTGGQMSASKAIGIDTSIAPEGFDETDDRSNPYGKRTVAFGNADELFVGDNQSGTIVGYDASSVGGTACPSGYNGFTYNDELGANFQRMPDSYVSNIKQINLNKDQVWNGRGVPYFWQGTPNALYQEKCEAQDAWTEAIKDVILVRAYSLGWFTFGGLNAPDTLEYDNRTYTRIEGMSQTGDSADLGDTQFVLYVTKQPKSDTETDIVTDFRIAETSGNLDNSMCYFDATLSGSGFNKSITGITKTNNHLTINARDFYMYEGEQKNRFKPVCLMLDKITIKRDLCYANNEGAEVNSHSALQDASTVNKTAGGNLDGNTVGKKNHYAMVGAVGSELRLSVVDALHPETSQNWKSLGCVHEMSEYCQTRIESTKNKLQARALYELYNTIAVSAQISVVTGDFDGNGTDDIAVYSPRAGEDARVEVYTKAVDGDPCDMDQWELKRTFSTKGTIVDIKASDLDGDGIDDLIIGDANAVVYWGAYVGMLNESTVLGEEDETVELEQSYAVTVVDEGNYSTGIQRYLVLGYYTSDPEMKEFQDNEYIQVSICSLDRQFIETDRVSIKVGGMSNRVAPKNYTPPLDHMVFRWEMHCANNVLYLLGATRLSYNYTQAMTLSGGKLGSCSTNKYGSRRTVSNYVPTETYDIPNFYHVAYDETFYPYIYGTTYRGYRVFVPYDFQVVSLNGSDDAGNTEQTVVYKVFEYKFLNYVDPAYNYDKRIPKEYETQYECNQYIEAVTPKLDTSNEDAPPKLTFGMNMPAFSSRKNENHVYAVLNTDDDTSYMTYTGEHWFTYTDPKVLAVLASPPYFKDLLSQDNLSGNYGESKTSFAKMNGSGDSSTVTNTISAGVTVGYEHKLRIMLAEVGSIEAQLNTKYNHAWEKSVSTETTYTQEFSTSSGSDAIVFYSVPYEHYKYTMHYIDPKTGEVYDDVKTVSLNKNPCIATIELEKYNAIAENYSELPKITDDIMKHTLGEPDTYPKSAAGYKNVREFKGNMMAVDFTSAGGGITESQSIEMTKENGDGYSNGVDVEASTSLTLFSVTAGVSAGYGYDYNSVHTTTEGSAFTAEIQNMPKEAEDYGYGMSWKLFSHEGFYKDKDGEDVTFPVVDYLVADVVRPPVVPKDLRQDYQNSTTKSVMLKWDYDQSDLRTVESFNVYRVAVVNGRRSEVLIGQVNKNGFDNSIYTRTVNDDGTVTYAFIDSGQNLSNPELRIELQPSAEYSYYVEAVRSINNPPPYSMPTETVSAFTRSESDNLDVSLDGVTGNKLTVYPDRAYNVRAVVSNTQHFISVGYQWQKKDSRNNWKNIFGATSDTLPFEFPSSDDTGEYRCRIDAFSYNQELHQQTCITVFTDEIDVTFKMREIQLEAFTATNLNGKTEVIATLCPQSQLCYVTPSGDLTFILRSASGEKRYTAPLVENGKKATAKLSDAEDFTEPEDGIYQVSVFYGGNDAFGSFTSEEPQSLLIGDSAIYPVLFNETGERTDTFYFGNTLLVRFFRYTKMADGTTTEQEIDVEGAPNGLTVSVTDEPGSYEEEISAKLAGEEQKTYSYSYTVKKRPLEVRVTIPELFTGNVEGNLPQMEIIPGTSLAAGDTLDEIVALKYMNGAKTREVTINNSTAPGTYYAALSATKSDKTNHYDLKLYSSMFTINALRYGVTITSEEDAGTVKMLTPESKSGIKSDTFRYESGSQLKLKAVPNLGYKFTEWRVAGLSNSQSIINDEILSLNTPSNDITITAYYTPYNGTITVDTQYAMGGKVILPYSFESGAEYYVGKQFTFAAEDANGAEFDHWVKVVGTRAQDIYTKTIDVTVSETPIKLYPVFRGGSCTVQLGSGIQGSYTYKNEQGETVSGTLVSGGTVPYGAELKLKATGSTNHFKWSVNGTEQSANETEITVAVNGTMNISINYYDSIADAAGKIKFTRHANKAVTSGDKNKVYVGFDADIPDGLTAEEYGLIYYNSGNVIHTEHLTLENIGICGIQKAKYWSANITDIGYGVVCVGYVKVKDSFGDTAVRYTEELGSSYAALTEIPDKAVTFTRHDNKAVTSNGKNKVYVGFDAVIPDGYTLEDYGLIYYNSGNVIHTEHLTLENVGICGIQKAKYWSANITDNGYGVTAVGFVKVKNAYGHERVQYTEELGNSVAEMAAVTKKVTLTKQANKAVTSNGKNKVYCGFDAALPTGYTVEDYGLIYYNSGTVITTPYLTLENVGICGIQKAKYWGANITDTGYGVACVGFVKVKAPNGYVTTLYSEELGNSFTAVSEAAAANAVTLTRQANKAVTASGKNKVYVGFTANVPAGYTVAEYGLIYYNSGNVIHTEHLTLENVGVCGIQKANYWGANITDNGYGVVCVGYVKVKDANGCVTTLYTGELGAKFADLTH